MAGTLYKARTTLTVWRRGLWRYRLTTVGGILAVAGAATALNDPPKAVNAVAGMAGLLVATLEIRSNRRRAAVVQFVPRKTDDYRDVEEAMSGRGRVVRAGTDVGIVLAAETMHLLTDSVDTELAPDDFVLHRELKPYSFDFLARRARKGAMHNDLVLGLASDVPTSKAMQPVKLRRAMYFDFICSNLLSQNDIHDTDRRSLILSGRHLFVDRRNTLRSLSESRLANTIGVSTLAFTNDGKLALVRQTEDTVGSPGLVAPSGSGALEPQDFELNDYVSPSLRDVVLRGAERELQEECNLKPEEVLASCLTGHARWISRGAMPEFCAVTILDITSDDLAGRHIRRPERPFVGEVTVKRLAPPEEWDPARPLNMLPEDFRHISSWPLALALSCLAERIADEAWPMRRQLLSLINR